MNASLLTRSTPTAVILSALLPLSAAAVETWVGTNGKSATSELGQADFTGDVRNRNAGPPANDRFFTPSDVVVDPTSGKVFVSDTNNHRVLRFESMTALQNGAAAEFVFGQADFVSATPAADRPGLNGPTGLALDSRGHLWVADSGNNRIVLYENAATRSTAFLDTLLGQPDEHATSAGTADNRLSNPVGLDCDSQDNLWVVDRNNQRVLLFLDPFTTDGTADKVLGESGFTNVSGGSSAASVNFPYDVAAFGDFLWISDTGNNRILRFDSVSTKMNGADADSVLGQTDFGIGFTNPGTTATALFQPHGLHVDPRGRLFVADTSNHRVLHFRAAASKGLGAPADGVLGKTTFTDGAPANAAANTMFGPIAVGCQGFSRLWVCDRDNHRVLRFDARNNSARISALRRQIRNKQKQIRRFRIKARRLRSNRAAFLRFQRNIRRTTLQIRRINTQIRVLSQT